MASRVALDTIRSLTFYNGEFTNAQRTSPIPQLKCIGKPCNLFQPDVVRCINDGGQGLDVQWKCEADLPDQLRFGRVEVSCEGWSRPGDPMVLKGSCGLEYRLLRIPSAYASSDDVPGPLQRLMPKDPYEAAFMLIWSLVLLVILYHFFKSCFHSRTRSGSTTRPANPHTRPGGNSGGGWFGHSPSPPPPYTPHYKPPTSWSGFGWQPGFWSGLGLGSLAATLWNSQRRNNAPPPVVSQRSMWDWERPTSWWGTTPVQEASPATASGGWFGGRNTGTARRAQTNEDRGEGTSNLGRMRTSTGYGGSSVR